MTIKKAELHVHLEGTIAPWLAKKIAHRNKLSIPDGLIDELTLSYRSNNFMHFLQVFDTLANLITRPEDYYDITYEYLKANALDDTIYVEMMYSPDHAEKSTSIPSIEHLSAIQQAIDNARSDYGIEGRILMTAVRHFGVESATKLAQNIGKQLLPCVTGFGLGGDEINYPPRLFKKAYQIADEMGLMCTVHAGEFAPASGIMEAIEHLPIKRIGHGVQAIHSPETIAVIKDRNIALEICPSSNIKLGLFKDFASHPLPRFLEMGILLSINSDDPPFMATNLAEEYKRVQESYQFNDEMMKSITRMAIGSAFVDSDTKKKLLDKI